MGFNTLMELPNCSFSEVSMEKYSSLWQQTVMDALNMSWKIKTTQRLQFPSFYSSHSIHWIKKFRAAKSCSYRNGTIGRIQQEVSLSVKVDKTVLTENLSPHSTHSSFNFLRAFSSNRLLNQLNWQKLLANTSNNCADLFNGFFSSVFQKV